MGDSQHGMVYDISRYLDQRKNQKKTINLEQFYELTKRGEIFVIEYTAQTKAQEHIIVWARRPLVARFDPGTPTLAIFDARVFDDLGGMPVRDREPALRSAMHYVKLDQIIAMRINQERYNWDLVSRSFVQE